MTSTEKKGPQKENIPIASHFEIIENEIRGLIVYMRERVSQHSRLELLNVIDMLKYVRIRYNTIEKLVKSRTSVLLKDNNPNKKLS